MRNYASTESDILLCIRHDHLDSIRILWGITKKSYINGFEWEQNHPSTRFGVGHTKQNATIQLTSKACVLNAGFFYHNLTRPQTEFEPNMLTPVGIEPALVLPPENL